MTPYLLQHPRIIQRSVDAPVPADLDAIGLVELNEQAEMLTRVGRKYIVTRSHIPDIMSGLDTGTKAPSIVGVRSQAYASTHLNTSGLRSFLDTARLHRRRCKIRTRAHLDSGIAFLEVEIRGTRNMTVKTRIPCSVESARAGRITAEGEAQIRKALTTAACETSTPGSLRPVLCGSYTRTTLLMPHGDGRAIIDSDLKWTNLRHVGTGDGEGASLKASDFVIIETKLSSTPSALDYLLWERGYRPACISKHAAAMATLDPSLPRNRRTRTLSRYLAA